MESVVVQLPDLADGCARDRGTAERSDGKPRLLSLGPGEAATFGQGGSAPPVDIALAGRGISRHAGQITAFDDYWRLCNFSRTATYVVENLEGGGEYVKVAPGRLGAPIPFELARVVLPLTAGFVKFTVFAPRHAFLDFLEPDAGTASGDPTVAPFSLDSTAKYFLVLLALCEARLRDPSNLAIPSVPEVVERLRPLPVCRDLTATAVNFHIDYLAGSKLRIRERTGAEQVPRIDWKREALVSLAMRFNLVRQEHLMMLPKAAQSTER